jgi:hypothetical protein
MWEAEKGELKSKEWIAADEHRKKLSHKNHYSQRVVWVYPDLHIPFFNSGGCNCQHSQVVVNKTCENTCPTHPLSEWKMMTLKEVPLYIQNKLGTKSFFCEQLQKLKERSKLFATMTVEHNQLLVQLGDIETHLSIAQTTKLVGCL